MQRVYARFNWPRMKMRESVTTGGKERRADIVVEVPVKSSQYKVIITIILEHKSYRDTNTVRQMLGYYNALAQESGGIILPIIVTCCKDKKATIPSDYLSWALQQQGAPEALKDLFKNFPNFSCLLVNLHDLSYRRMRRGGEAVALALFGMRNYWDMDEDVVVEILGKAQLLAQQEREFVLSVLMDYYECADKGFDRKGFARVERKRFPHLQEGGWIVPDTAFGIEGAEQRGIQRGMRRGMRKGKQQGIEQGMQRGIEQGMQRGIEQERQDAATRMLTHGMPEEQIQDVLQLTAKELAQIKCRLKN